MFLNDIVGAMTVEEASALVAKARKVALEDSWHSEEQGNSWSSENTPFGNEDPFHGEQDEWHESAEPTKTVAKTWDQLNKQERLSGVKGRTVWNEKTRKYTTVFDVPATEQVVAEADTINLNDDDWYEVNPATKTIVGTINQRPQQAVMGRPVKLPNGNYAVKGMTAKHMGLTQDVGEGYAGIDDTDTVGFSVNSEAAYTAVMDHFGDHIDHDETSGIMYVPASMWPNVEAVAFDADGVGAEQDDGYEHPDSPEQEVDEGSDQKKPTTTHTSDCGYRYGHDCDCKGKLAHAGNCGYKYGHDCDCGLTKSKDVSETAAPITQGAKVTWFHSTQFPKVEGTVIGKKDGKYIVQAIDPSPRNTAKSVTKYLVSKNNIVSQGVAEATEWHGSDTDREWYDEYKNAPVRVKVKNTSGMGGQPAGTYNVRSFTKTAPNNAEFTVTHQGGTMTGSLDLDKPKTYVDKNYDRKYAYDFYSGRMPITPRQAFNLMQVKKQPSNGQQGVAEGFGDTIKRGVKSVKRRLKGWDKDAVGPGGEELGNPRDIVTRNKGYDDEKIKRLHAAGTAPIGFPFRQGDFAGKDKHSPGGLQQRVLDREMKKRGLGEEGVAEGESTTQKYEMMMRNGQVKKFIAKDDADAKRIAAGHGAKSVIKLKGGVPAGKVSEQGVAEMDSSGPKGRMKSDGTRSHSTYGSRDHYSDADPQSTAKPVTVKDFVKNATKILTKHSSKKQGVAEAEGEESTPEAIAKINQITRK